MDNTTRRTVIRNLARRFIERAEALGYKGKKRDDAALDYFVGAATAFDLSGDPDTGQALGVICAMMVSVRGYFAVRELAAESIPVT